MGNAIEEIITERIRQVEGEGWSRAHDDKHAGGELARAAATYAYAASLSDKRRTNISGANGLQNNILASDLWPFAQSWWKPTTRRRDLVKAGALIVAEIERLDRAAAADTDACPICDRSFVAGDTCALDIELGTCHAACLEGSPTVDLDTGEPIDGPIPTFPYVPLNAHHAGEAS